MKLFFVCLFFGILTIHAEVSSQVYSISLENASLRDVIQGIEKQGDYRFFFSDDVANLNRSVQVDVSNATIEQVLNAVLTPHNLGYRIMENNLVIISPYVSVRQGIAITGTVTDETGETMPGVNITVKGTINGTVTDMDGKYGINVPDGNAVLVYSFIGYAPQEMMVGDRLTIDVTLAESTTEIDEVVVVGYGTVKKVNLTGSVSSVSAGKLENRAVPNLSTSLTGLAAGVSVRQSSGNPGEDGANIRIRGIGTFSGDYRSPMVLVDGFESSMDAVNPNDVENISILKDASSAAIYGSRGANGVILVTTRKGRQETRPSITYSGIFSLAQPEINVHFLSDYAEFMDLMNFAQRATNPTAQLTYGQDEIDEWRAAKNNPDGMSKYGVANRLAYPNTDWSDVTFEPRFAQNHNISVTGGSANTNYMLSLGYMDNPGIMQNTALNRYTARINLESRITKFLKVGTHTYFLRQDKEVGNEEAARNFFYQVLPGVVPYHDGKYGGQTATADPSTTNNALALLNDRDGNRRTHRINTSLFATVNLLDGLTFDAKFNYQTRQYFAEQWSVTIDKYNFRTGLMVNEGAREANATTYRQGLEEYRYTTNFLLNYAKTFGDHSVSGLLGYEQMYYNYKSFNATRKGLMDMSIYDITAGLEMSDVNGEYERDYAMVSWFGRLGYTYKSKYILDATLRRDGSSRFSPESRWGVFPSVSAAWRVSEESFFESMKTYVNSLKLRAAWGQLGNTTSGYYDWQASYAGQNNSFGGTVADGLAVSKIANEYLQWENISSSEIGLEAAFLKHRLSLEANFYNKLTEGILTSPAIYSTMGIATAPTKNTADMRNRGIEIMLNWNDQISDFRYSASVNVAYNVNRVVKYLGQMKEAWENDAYVSNIGQTASFNGNNIVTEDHTYNEYFLRPVYSGSGGHYLSDGSVDINGGPTDGMIRTPEDLKWVQDMQAAGYKFGGRTTTGGTGLNYGELIMADVNGDKDYGNAYDRAFSDKSDSPSWTFGFTANAAWKGFDLNMTWAGSFGMWYYMRERGINQNNFISNGNVLPADARSMFYYYNAADPADPANNINAPHPRMLYGNDGAYVASNFYLYNASYMKLKFLQLGYTLPQSLTEKVHVGKVRVFVSGENLLTITDYPGMDPEIGGSANPYPFPKMFSGGISVTF